VDADLLDGSAARGFRAESIKQYTGEIRFYLTQGVFKAQKEKEKMKPGKYIWRALKRHVEKGHTLRVHLIDEFSNDLQIDCVFCGIPLMAGSPVLVKSLEQQLKEVGVKIVRPILESQVVS
jgi:hypothetical protein